MKRDLLRVGISVLIAALATVGALTVAAPAGAVTCPGPGPGQETVRAVYAIPHNRDQVDRSSYQQSVGTYIDDLIDYSSGPAYDQNLRWVCDPNGNLDVAVVKMSSDVLNGRLTFDAVRAEVDAALGTTSTQIRLVWVELSSSDCFIGPDDKCIDGQSTGMYSAVKTNFTHATKARKVEAHELWHVLGACHAAEYNSGGRCANPVDRDGVLDDTIDVEGGDRIGGLDEVPAHCGVVQIDCGKNDYYSAAAAAGAPNRFTNSPSRNTALSPWLTPVVPSSLTLSCIFLGSTRATEADDVIGSSGALNVSTLDGNDTVDDGDGINRNQFICSGDGADTLHGRLGTDWLVGGAGNDTISGGGGDDTVLDGPGHDVMDGGAGYDTVWQCLEPGIEPAARNFESVRTASTAECQQGNFLPLPTSLLL